MSLGSSFPPAYRKAQIERQLKPGSVIKLIRKMDDGQFHEKRYVVMHVDERTITCVINSDIGAFVRARPTLLKCQVSMPKVTHVYMQHDSHVDCSRLRQFATSDVVLELMNKPDWVLGKITIDLRDEIVGAIKFSETISVADVETICQSLAQIE